ncbi:MAG: integrase, partial [Pseudomonadota bacterium]
MAKREYLAAMRRRYRCTEKRAEKSRILDEICATTGYDRKHAIRSMGEPRRRPSSSRPGRRPIYRDPSLLKALKAIWMTGNLPCSKRLKAMLPIWLPHYEQSYGSLDEGVREKLLAISPASIDRVLSAPRSKYKNKGRCTTKPGGLLRAQIPIQTAQWQQTKPGFLEADTVSHCGGVGSGQFAFTLDCVDIATGWTEQRAIWCKNAKEVLKQMRSIERNLPFPLLGFDSDNGSEFINETLMRHFLSRHRPVLFTRSRAYHKDDNAHVEQKNWTHVRQWIGYGRIDTPDAVELLNSVYENEWRLFHNLYCPSMKLIEKRREGSKLIRVHDTPKTPYQRVMESEHVSDYKKRGVKEIYEKTNPFTLRRAIETRFKKLKKLLNS